MWLIISAISILFYAFSSVFQKMGLELEEDYSELKVLFHFGVFSGIAALGIRLLGLKETSLLAFQILKSNPLMILSPLLYLGSLLASFVAFKYIPAHLEAPLSNTDGLFSFIGVLIVFPFINPEVFDEEITVLRIICVFLLLASILILYWTEAEEADIEANKKRAGGHILGRGGNFPAVGILFGLLGGFLDGSSSLVDIIILGGSGESFDYIYFTNVLSFAVAVVIWFVLLIKEKKPYIPFRRTELPKITGAASDCIATVFYMMAISRNPIFAAPLISANCVLGIFLSRFILKEEIGDRKKRSIILTLAALFIFIAVDEFT